MNDKICMFAGTTEGRRLAALLCGAVDLTVCVATEYGEVMLDGIGGITVHTGRMDEREMEAFFARGGFGRVIDATHPYAELVSENIASAAKKTGIPVMRVLREADKKTDDAVYVSSVEEARDFLSAREGNIFITTGAKELASYVGLDMSRVWARVLPVASSLEACETAGIPVSHIIAAQGPFSEETNLAELRAVGAKYIVTKSSGKSGGFEEKIGAAKKAGATAVIIGKPAQGEGLTFDEAVAVLEKLYAVSKRKIYLVGVGPGNRELLTAEARSALDGCDAVIGAKSVVETLGTKKTTYFEFTPDGVKKVLEEHSSVRRAAVVMRGDVGFFSGAKKMLEAFENEDVTVIPGISSIVCFASKLGVSWDDAATVSLHGRDGNVIRTVDENKKTFVLTGGDNTVRKICAKLCDYGFGDLSVAVGEKLTYPDEKITRGSAAEISLRDCDPLSVMYIENPAASRRVRRGIPDDEFIRGDVPITKSEVRSISLSKLAPEYDSVVWDVGAGTGSVSVECALASPNGRVYAIEKEADAVDLIEKNKIKFRADNIEVTCGAAPEALRDLPVPTHVFIGGSSGNMRGILSAVINKNPRARIVINTVTLESQADVTESARSLGLDIEEAVAVQISRSKKAGRYHLMSAQNPVYVFVLNVGEEK